MRCVRAMCSFQLMQGGELESRVGGNENHMNLTALCSPRLRHPPAFTGDMSPLCRAQEDAKLAFKQLLGSVGTRSDWSWEQAMRLIVSDPRCVSES